MSHWKLPRWIVKAQPLLPLQIFLLSSKDKYRVVLMTSVGLVMCDQQGRELSPNLLVDLSGVWLLDLIMKHVSPM